MRAERRTGFRSPIGFPPAPTSRRAWCRGLPLAAAVVAASGPGVATAPTPPPESARSERPQSEAPRSEASAPGSIDGLRAEGLGLLESLREGVIGLPEARAGVERLRRSLVELGEASGWTPSPRRLELSIARPGEAAAAPVEDCPLFLEENLVQLCPLDQSRSELWSDRVVVCQYACAPESPPPGSLPPAPPPDSASGPGSGEVRR